MTRVIAAAARTCPVRTTAKTGVVTTIVMRVAGDGHFSESVGISWVPWVDGVTDQSF